MTSKEKTARYRPLLEAIHAGTLPGYASGGFVMDPSMAYSNPGPAAMASQPVNLTGMRLEGTLLVNGMEARMQAVAVGVVAGEKRSAAGSSNTMRRSH